MALTDLRYALRTLHRARGFAFVTVATLALGIGATTAIFAAVSAFFLRPLPYPDADRILRLRESFGQTWQGSVSEENFLDWKEQTKTLRDFVALTNESFNLASESPERLPGQRVTENFFRLFRTPPALGRPFSADELQPGANPVVVLAHGLWQRQFGGDPKIVGKTIELSGKTYTVTGVMPDGFRYPGDNSQLWVPMALEKKRSRGNRYLQVMARLRDGVTLEAARADMEAIGQNLAAAYPDTNTNRSVHLLPLREQLVGQLRPQVVMLSIAVLVVLLIGCANVANLLLARASGRQGEIAVRMALGANRWRLVRQLLTESLVLALLGGCLGVLVAMWGVDLLQAGVPGDSRALFPFRIDGGVLGFALGASVLSAFLFGLVPALQSSRHDLSSALRDGGTRTTTGRTLLKKVLVVAEVSLSVMLLVVAGLLLRSMSRLGDVPLGFSPENVLTMQISLPQARYPDDKASIAFYQRLVQGVEGLPGVVSAGVINDLPLSTSNWNSSFTIVGRPEPPKGQEWISENLLASPDYFRTLGIRLLAGRNLDATDREGAPPVVLVNETFVARYLGGQNPIGTRVMVRGDQPREIVGVVSDVRRWGQAKATVPETYFPAWQGVFETMTLAVRTKADPSKMIGAVRAQVAAVDPGQAVFAVRTMSDIVGQSVAVRRFQTLLISLFAAVALVLASLGIYGVMAYHVGQRTQELGIRMALGARAAQLQGMVVREGMVLAVVGLVIGLGVALLVSYLLRSMLFEVGPTDLPSYALAASVLGAVAFLACWLPARRATRVDPVAALRAS